MQGIEAAQQGPSTPFTFWSMATATFRNLLLRPSAECRRSSHELDDMAVKDYAVMVPNSFAPPSNGVRLDDLPAEIIELIAFFLARHDIVETRFKYSFIRGIFSLRLSCRTIALKLDRFFRKAFETLNVDLSCNGLQRAVLISQAPHLASRVRSVRLGFTLVVPDEDELLNRMAEAVRFDEVEMWWPVLDDKRRIAIDEAKCFISGFGRVFLARAFAKFPYLRELRFPLEDKQWASLEGSDPLKKLLDMISISSVSALLIAHRKIEVLGFADDFDIWLSLGSCICIWMGILRFPQVLGTLTSLEMSVDSRGWSKGPWGRYFLERINSTRFPQLQKLSLHADFASRQDANWIDGTLDTQLTWPQALRYLSLDGFCIPAQRISDASLSLPLPKTLQELALRNCIFSQEGSLSLFISYITSSGLRKLHLFQIGCQGNRVSFEGFPYAKEGDVQLYYEQRGEITEDTPELAKVRDEYVWVENNKYELEVNSANDNFDDMLGQLYQCWKVQDGLSVNSSSEYNFWWDPSDVPAIES